MPVLAKLAAQVAADRAKGQHARAREKVVERFLFNRIDADAACASVGVERHPSPFVATHDAAPPLPFFELAEVRTHVALDHLLVDAAPVLRRVDGHRCNSVLSFSSTLLCCLLGYTGMGKCVRRRAGQQQEQGGGRSSGNRNFVSAVPQWCFDFDDYSCDGVGQGHSDGSSVEHVRSGQKETCQPPCQADTQAEEAAKKSTPRRRLYSPAILAFLLAGAAAAAEGFDRGRFVFLFAADAFRVVFLSSSSLSQPPARASANSVSSLTLLFICASHVLSAYFSIAFGIFFSRSSVSSASFPVAGASSLSSLSAGGASVTFCAPAFAIAFAVAFAFATGVASADVHFDGFATIFFFFFTTFCFLASACIMRAVVDIVVYVSVQLTPLALRLAMKYRYCSFY
eukprot:Rhum_TRINITY_DN8079_c0_g1::Rhum_TRINITY_DN8079_c0_g1_i1::g.26081::m.26081